MRLSRLIPAFGFALVVTLSASYAGAGEFNASDLTSFRDAIDDAIAGGDVENFINLTESEIHIPVAGGSLEFPVDFDGDLHVTVRPDPAADFDRAAIISEDPFSPIIIVHGGYVTFQDLDILRDNTNTTDLVQFHDTGHNEFNTIERCRIGSIWTVPGVTDVAYVSADMPTHFVIRNSIFFALPGGFERGIEITTMDEPARSVFLYNNLVADYGAFGIGGSGISIINADAGVIVLRNNIVVNRPDADPEPIAYRSDVAAAVAVIRSHNVSFASAGNEEDVIGAQGISGSDDAVGSAYLLFAPTDAELDDAFVAHQWDRDVPANTDFWRLLADGTLHGEAEFGANVELGRPAVEDIPIVDDIEGDPRPAADLASETLHTDRGPDQVAAGIVEIIARAFTVGGSRVLRLASGRPIWCAQLEPIGGSFSLSSLDLGSIRLVSPGTGSVSEIPAISGKSIVLADADMNFIEDIRLCFRKTDLRMLFANLTERSTVPVDLTGRLTTGETVRAHLDLDVVAGGGSLAAAVSPNPLNPAGTLSFVTTRPGFVRAYVFDLEGRRVGTLLEASQVPAGRHDLPIGALSERGTRLSSGVHFFRVITPEGIETGRFTVLK